MDNNHTSNIRVISQNIAPSVALAAGLRDRLSNVLREGEDIGDGAGQQLD